MTSQKALKEKLCTFCFVITQCDGCLTLLEVMKCLSHFKPPVSGRRQSILKLLETAIRGYPLFG